MPGRKVESSEELINYVVGYKNKDGSMNIYSYGCEVQHGSLEGAQHFLEYVRRQTPTKKEQKKFHAYQVAYIRLPDA